MSAHAESHGHGTPLYKNPYLVGWAAWVALEATTHAWEQMVAPSLIALSQLVQSKIGLTLAGWSLATVADIALGAGVVGAWIWATKKVWEILKKWYHALPGGSADAHH